MKLSNSTEKLDVNIVPIPEYAEGDVPTTPSAEKMDIDIVETPWKNGKEWVKVTLRRYQSFFPSFEDVHRIVRAIAECEDRKYPNGKGRKKFREFLIESLENDDYEDIARQFQIPIRDGEKVVNPNGARIEGDS